MNASMCDSHNLGTSIVLIARTAQTQSHHSLEAHTGSQRMGRYVAAQDREYLSRHNNMPRLTDWPLQYEAERRTYAEDLISFDKTWSKLLSSRSANDKAEETVQDGLLRYFLHW